MGFVIVTYDVDREHIKVKDEMVKKGYAKTWISQNHKYYLPNTTLWRKEGTTEQAIHDIKIVCSSLSVKLKRAVAVIADSWNGIEGEDFDR